MARSSKNNMSNPPGADIGDDRLRTPEAPLPRELALREFYQVATGKEPPQGPLTRQHVEEIEFTENLVQRLGAIGLATITSLALRGHFRASEYLANKCIGELRKPFGESVRNMSLSDAEELLYLEYTQTMKLSPAVARKMVEAAKRVETMELAPEVDEKIKALTTPK